MLYYQVIYNVSATCFAHYLAIIRLYWAYRLTVLDNQRIYRETRSRLQWSETWTQLIGWYQYLISTRILYCTVLYYTMLCYAMLFYAMLFYAMLYYVILCCAVLCYAMLCYAMLRCAMLYTVFCSYCYTCWSQIVTPGLCVPEVYISTMRRQSGLALVCCCGCTVIVCIHGVFSNCTCCIVDSTPYYCVEGHTVSRVWQGICSGYQYRPVICGIKW